jgi:hypothetical protein
MQIKVQRIEDGPARVEVIDPATGQAVSSADVNVGQEVVVTTSDNPGNPPYIGEVCAIAPEDAPGDPCASEQTEAPAEPAAEDPGAGAAGDPPQPGQDVPADGQAT